MRERKSGNYKQYFEEKDICFFLLNFVRMLHKNQLKQDLLLSQDFSHLYNLKHQD